jgi:transcriptional regulator with XRE-family HTH domain
MDLTQQIGQRLRGARLAQGLTLGELSARTASPLSKSRIGNYEQGIRPPGLEEARELAGALGIVSATYLLCLENAGYLSDAEQGLLRHFRATDARGRATILDVARSVADAAGETG